MADMQWFYAKSKVPICLAITDSFHFLSKLKCAGILTEEEALELQGDTRTAHRVVYECLCWIEDKDLSSEHFFTFLFQKSLLKRYPDLKPIHAEYIEGKYGHGLHSTTDEDKDPLIFAQEKVHICLTITDRFPFLHGLQDLTILSESESLKLQADERPVSRVIYDSLSLIEKKDLKLNIVFEYIFQPCYLKLYPGLQDILQEPSGEFLAPFNGGQYPIFNIASDLLEYFEHNKAYICEAVNTRFPFLHGLHDRGLLSHIQLLKLQADKKPTKEVLNEALCHIKTISDIENFFAYLFQEFYLKLYPDLHVTLQCLNAALRLDICAPSTASGTEKIPETQVSNAPVEVLVKAELIELSDQNSNTTSTVTLENGIIETEQDSTEQSQGSNGASPSPSRNCRMQSTSFSDPPDLDQDANNGEKESEGSDDSPPIVVRRCRKRPINYSEPPDLDWDVLNVKKGKSSYTTSSPKKPKLHKYWKRKAQETNSNVLKNSNLHSNRHELLQGSDDTSPVVVRRCRKQPINYFEPPDLDWDVLNVEKGKSSYTTTSSKKPKLHKYWKRKAQETNNNVLKNSNLHLNRHELLQGSDDSPPIVVRRCRTRPINYSEPPDLDWDVLNVEKGKSSYTTSSPKMPKLLKYWRRKVQETNSNVLKNSNLHLNRHELQQVTTPVSVKVEFPKQVFNEKFRVRCGNKIGIFKKSRWTGHSSKDICIQSEGKKFSVVQFEKYGGKGSSKNWKKSIQCEAIKLEGLIEAGILKRPIWNKKSKKKKKHDPEWRRTIP